MSLCKTKGIVLEKKIFTNHVASKRQGKKKSSKCEDRLCYICRRKGHLCKDCLIGNYSTPSLSIGSYVTRQPKIATCTRKVMSLQSVSTKDIWVLRSLLTNLDGPIKRWWPKYAWQALHGKGDDMKLWRCLSGLIQFLLTQAINLTMFYISKIDLKLFWIIISKTHHLEQDIDVVGNKGLSCVENQSLQHGGKPKDGNTCVFKCKYLQLSFLLCLV
jgi:hypothetical protein